jgi:RNA polymerase sigma factor (sigma-70 family)
VTATRGRPGPERTGAESDAHDEALLRSGRFADALARHLPALRARARARLRPEDDPEDILQQVLLRVWREHASGREWRHPFRVILHRRLDWTLKDHFAARRPETGFPDGLDPADERDPIGEVEDRHLVEGLIAALPRRDGQVARMRYLGDAEPRDIADALGMEPNAVHQSLHRARKRLRPALSR